MLGEDKRHIIAQRQREGNIPTSDSDDEQVPNLPIVPVFDDVNLGLVQYMFNKLHRDYFVASKIGFYNALGKRFIGALGEYANLCCSNPEQHKYLINTSTGPTQTGAFFLKWAMESRKGKEVIQIHERYADAVFYETVGKIPHQPIPRDFGKKRSFQPQRLQKWKWHAKITRLMFSKLST